MSNTIEAAILGHFTNQRPSHEHKDRLYPTHSSAYITYPKYKKLQGKCLRAAYYSCMGYQEEVEMNTDRKLVAKLGEYTEEMLLDIFRGQDILVDSAVRFETDKPHISGKLDAIILENEKEVGVEIKSIGGNNKYVIDSIWGNGGMSGYPKWQNLFQTLVYCYAFRERLSHFYIVYIRRDTCERKFFKVSIEPIKGKVYPVVDGKVDWRLTLDEILERYSMLHKYLDSDKLPPAEYIKTYNKEDVPKFAAAGILSARQAASYNQNPFGDFECRYCGYRSRCDKEQ